MEVLHTTPKKGILKRRREETVEPDHEQNGIDHDNNKDAEMAENNNTENGGNTENGENKNTTENNIEDNKQEPQDPNIITDEERNYVKTTKSKRARIKRAIKAQLKQTTSELNQGNGNGGDPAQTSSVTALPQKLKVSKIRREKLRTKIKQVINMSPEEKAKEQKTAWEPRRDPTIEGYEALKLPTVPNLSKIKNREQRDQIMNDYRKQHAEMRKALSQRRKELGIVPITRTIDNTRLPEETFVDLHDEEAIEDIKEDKLKSYFTGKTPKVLITSSMYPSKKMLNFIDSLMETIPNSTSVMRRNYKIRDMIKFCRARDYTDLLVVNQFHNKPSGLLHIHLPNGPTADYKLTSPVLPHQIHGSGRPTIHHPELILNNFNTRVGHTVGRLLAALFPQRPEFAGRRVVTFHNQRDFIFFRHHRYIYESRKRVRLQECGPRFCLKLRSLQDGAYDNIFPEYEWINRVSQFGTFAQNKKRFHL